MLSLIAITVILELAGIRADIITTEFNGSAAGLLSGAVGCANGVVNGVVSPLLAAAQPSPDPSYGYGAGTPPQATECSNMQIQSFDSCTLAPQAANAQPMRPQMAYAPQNFNPQNQNGQAGCDPNAGNNPQNANGFCQPTPAENNANQMQGAPGAPVGGVPQQQANANCNSAPNENGSPAQQCTPNNGAPTNGPQQANGPMPGQAPFTAQNASQNNSVPSPTFNPGCQSNNGPMTGGAQGCPPFNPQNPGLSQLSQQPQPVSQGCVINQSPLTANQQNSGAPGCAGYGYTYGGPSIVPAANQGTDCTMKRAILSGRYGSQLSRSLSPIPGCSKDDIKVEPSFIQIGQSSIGAADNVRIKSDSCSSPQLRTESCSTY